MHSFGPRAERDSEDAHNTFRNMTSEGYPSQGTGRVDSISNTEHVYAAVCL